MTVVTYHQTTAAVWIDVILQEGAPEARCVAPSGADVDSIDAEQRCVCGGGGGRPGAGTQFCSGHKPQREPRRERNSRQVNNNNLICISIFEAAVCLVQRPMCSEVTLKYYVQLKFVETSLM